ncbi:MAG: hypothetical protein EOP00_18830 [Pedobacter sp.]|nr:MAG: hypothetical protein EOP00_18830 [Pedobacter sp.]
MKRFLTLICIFLFTVSLKAQVVDTIKKDTLKFIPNQKPIITVGEAASKSKHATHNKIAASG